jgi:hypothetical protein
MQRIGSPIMERLSSTTGASQDTLQKATNGAVPALLAGLASIAARPGGGNRLATALQQLDPAMLDTVYRPSGEGIQQDVVDKGGSLLTSLFGGQTVDGLVSAIGQFCGLQHGAVQTLLGFLTPLILGVLGRAQQSAGPGAAGIAQILLDQKDKIAAALPPGLANLLQGSEMLSSVADRLKQGAATATAAAPSMTKLGTGAAQGEKTLADLTSRWSSRWPLALAAAAILAILGYWVFSPSRVEEANRPPAETTAPAIGSGTSMGVTQLDLGRQFTAAIDTTRQTLQGVSDAASAKQALPQLTDAVAQLSKLTGQAAQASPQDRKALADMVEKAIPQLRGLMDQVMAKPGVADVLKPTLDSFTARLADLSTA